MTGDGRQVQEHPPAPQGEKTGSGDVSAYSFAAMQ